MSEYYKYIPFAPSNYDYLDTVDDDHLYVKKLIDGAFNIILYRNTSEINRVDKAGYLTNLGEIIGVLREECSMLTPSIVYQSESVPTFNYVYIPIFNRYYFVTSLSSVSKNVWRMELNCDVLMSYKDAILSLEGVIARQEYEYNSLLIDDKLPTQNNTITEIIEPTISPKPFNTVLSASEYNCVLTVIK